MKVLILFSTLLFSLTSLAETEANWFSPDCKECIKMLKPGEASLANNKGVLNSKSKKKKPVSTPVSGTNDVSK